MAGEKRSMPGNANQSAKRQKGQKVRFPTQYLLLATVWSVDKSTRKLNDCIEWEARMAGIRPQSQH
jgi:hypothetical protein